MGVLYLDTRRPKLAAREHQAALTIHKRLADTHPEVIGLLTDLAGSYANLARVALAENRSSEALEAYALAIAALDKVLAKEPRDAVARQYLAYALTGKAESLTRLGKFAESIPQWDRGIDLDNGGQRKFMRLGRAYALAKKGDHVRAAKDVGDLANDKTLEPALVDIAAVWSLAAAAAQEDRALSASQRTTIAGQYGDQALKALGRAYQAGLFADPANKEKLKTDLDYAWLRPREDFKKLLAQVESAAKSGGP